MKYTHIAFGMTLLLSLSLFSINAGADTYISFSSNRSGNFDIYVMNADGARQVRRLTKNRSGDADPAWFDPAFAIEVDPFAVGPTGKKFTIWGRLKQVDR